MKVKKCNFRNGGIQCQISKSVNVTDCIFALALAVCEIFTFQKFYLENVRQGQGYNVRNGTIRWQIRTSIKVVLHIFALYLTVSEILTFKIFDLEN